MSKLSREPSFGPNPTNIGRFGQNVGRSWPRLTHQKQISAQLGRCWPNFGRCLPKLTSFGQPTFNQYWPNLGIVGQRRPKSGQTRPGLVELGQYIFPKSANLGRTRAESRPPGQLLDNFGTTLLQLLGCGANFRKSAASSFSASFGSPPSSASRGTPPSHAQMCSATLLKPFLAPFVRCFGRAERAIRANSCPR